MTTLRDTLSPQLRDLIDAFHGERRELDAAIAALERLAAIRENKTPPAKRRGRKSMGAAERQQVSARMRRYWASRRKEAPRP